jgi:hypothetical protein
LCFDVADYRFAAEYMSYAEGHLLNSKKSSQIQSNSSYVAENLLAEEFTTVPVTLVRKYLYLYDRYAFADGDQVMETGMYQPDATNPQLWAPILAQAKVNVSILQASAANMPFAL